MQITYQSVLLSALLFSRTISGIPLEERQAPAGNATMAQNPESHAGRIGETAPDPDTLGVLTGPRNTTQNPRAPRAIYTMSNNFVGNSIIALPVNRDGTVGKGTVTLTGDTGASGYDIRYNRTAGPDALFSQSSLVMHNGILFAINAGGNTISLLKADDNDPTRLTPLGNGPVALPGDFPNSIAVSGQNNLVCVSSIGVNSGISCANFGDNGIEGSFDDLRPIALASGAFNPPRGPPGTISQTFFSQDGSLLYTTVKGTMTGTPGFLSSFPVVESFNNRPTVGRNETRSMSGRVGAIFGVDFIPNTPNIMIADASFGVVLASLNGSQYNQINRTTLPNQFNTCWVKYCATTDSLFVTDTVVDRVVELDKNDGSIINLHNLNLGNFGLLDIDGMGDFLYTISPGNATIAPAVNVVDVSGGRGSATPYQRFDLSPYVATISLMGMAYYA